MAIVITGGSGFFGRHVVRRLLATEGDEIVVVDGDVGERADARVTMVRGDVCDFAFLTDTFAAFDVTRVVHLAYVMESPSDGPRGQIETNVMGTTNVLEAARLRGISRVVYMSSAYVYPHRRTLDGHRYTEDDPPAPDGIYGACKVAGEHLAEQYARLYGLDAIGLRFTAVFGPGRSERAGIASDDINVLPERAARGEAVVMPPDDQLCDWMYAADAAEVIRLALASDRKGHRVYNVASECRKVGEVTEIVRRLVPGADITVSDEPFVTTSLLSTDRLRDELGFVPRYSLESAFAEYLDGVRVPAA